MKTQELINWYNSLTKEAFIPNPQPEQDQAQLQQAYAQLQQVLGSAPPEVQQQIAPMLQQLQQFPPQEQLQQISGLIQQLSQTQQPQQQEQPPQGDQPAPEQESGNVNAENNLDNTKVTLSVRELLDLSSGGKATQSLLKVKQMADAHNKKMEAAQQQMEQEQASQQQEQQQQSAMGQGGIYAQPMNAGQGQQAQQ